MKFTNKNMNNSLVRTGGSGSSGISFLLIEKTMPGILNINKIKKQNKTKISKNKL